MTSADPVQLPRSDAARNLLASKLRSKASGQDTSASRGAASSSGSNARRGVATGDHLQQARADLNAAASNSAAQHASGSRSSEADLEGRKTGQGMAERPDATPAGEPVQEGQPTATPLPPLRALPPPKPYTAAQLAGTTFEKPRKRIVSPASLQKWDSSQAFDEVLGFVMWCNDAVVGHKLTEDLQTSPALQAIIDILNTINDVVSQTPAEKDSTSRFGNAAFRTLYARVKEQSRALHRRIPGLGDIKGKQKSDGQDCDAIDEIETYFIESFGNEKRIDYGSGMELNFACWLLCLVKLGVLDLEKEAPALVLRVFWRYVEVMRNVQSTYWLEPAGSHGVWGLDDYHFLPFLFGSAQLKNHKYLKPKSIHDPEVLDEFAKDYMYFACIRFINSIKTASLRWHSPMLDDISGVKKWDKVNEGMLKMYRAEVLLKLPIAQHIYFGSLLQFGNGNDEDDDDDELARAVADGGVVHQDELGRVHVHSANIDGADPDAQHGSAASATGWGDCCGIPIPSAFAAANEERNKLKGAGGLRFEGGSGMRRVPFD